ncbi:metal ABC transporter permease [Scopulibacillus cellulosilyticus]|uniref:Metal ABC transporter permease n=1 Tax=Scopulibacillus cellulosilyticus TaxID=2665665 RepID=A0ABW2PWG9_9BACL
MIEFFQNLSFMKTAFLVGIIVGCVTPLVGVFIFARRLPHISESLSQMNLAGIAIGSTIGSAVPYLSGINPSIYGAVFALIGAFLVELLRKVFRDFSDMSIPIILSLGTGLGALFFSILHGFNSDFFNYLFGSLIAVNQSDLNNTLTISIIVVVILLIFYRPLLLITFDAEYAQVSGIRKKWIDLIFMVIMSLTISVSVQAVGVMLVTGLMTLPIATAIFIGKSFKSVLVLAIIFGELAVLIGLVLSYYLSIATGGAIITFSLLCFLLVLGIKYIYRISSRHNM